MSERRGTVNFEAGAKSYALRLGTAQLAQIEDHFNLGINAALKKLGNDPRVGDLAQILAIGTGVSRDEAFEIMDEIGTEKAGNLVSQAVQASFGKDDATADSKAGSSGNGKSRKPTR